ncbi:MAG TPA: hypothetical protein VFE30_11945 [Anaeromyxobacteraceae bacterium]|nr:hypothetical protein [Anaeromyxobacteraceae bacterium]
MIRGAHRWWLAVLAGAATSLAAAQGPARAAAQAEASAARDWRAEFEAVCSKTQDAMTLSPEELSSLVARCDALKPRLEALDESGRKVWLERLRRCRDLYQFVLEAKGREKEKA